MARRRHSRRRRGGGSFHVLYKLLSTLAICAAVVLAMTLFFRVDDIRVTGAERYTEQQIIEATGVSVGDNLFLLNKRDAVDRLEKKLSYIEHVRIRRKLPDKLEIQVEECSAAFALTQDNAVWIFGPSGKIVEKQEAPMKRGSFPVVDGCRLTDPAVGEAITLKTEFPGQQDSLLALMQALEDTDQAHLVQSVHLDDLALLTMDFAGRFRVEMPYGADYDRKLSTLAAVVDKLESNETGTIRLTRDDGQVNFIRR